MEVEARAVDAHANLLCRRNPPKNVHISLRYKVNSANTTRNALLYDIFGRREAFAIAGTAP